MDLNTLFQDYNPKHSKYQIDNFIIGVNGRTTYGQYRQSLRELYPRYLNVKKTLITIMELETELEEWENKADEGSTRYKLNNATKNMKIAILAESNNNLAQQLKEFKYFYSIAAQIKTEIGALTEEDIDTLEQEYWVTTFKERVALEILANGRVSMAALETIIAMPERNEILDHMVTMATPSAALAYLKGLTSKVYKAGELITDTEAMTLIEGPVKEITGNE